METVTKPEGEKRRDVAGEIAREAARLQSEASRNGYDFLAYLLAMVADEAEQTRDRS